MTTLFSPTPPLSMTLSSSRRALALAVSTVVTGTASSASAQDVVLEEVIVTATKRSANMQELPQSIQAFTTEDIERRGFTGIDDYAKQIPGIAFSRREPGGTSIIFRGVSTSGFQFGTNASSSVYLDEQPITTAGLNPDPRLIDVARIEALSGPQGTLFGDASQSGTLRIITNKPDTSEFAGWIDGSFHSVDDGDTGYEVSAMVNIPVSENVAIRLTGFTNKDAGYIDNIFAVSQGGTFDNAGLVEDDINSSEMSGGRIGVRANLSEDWTLDLMAVFQDKETDGFGDVNTSRDDLEQARFNPETLDEEWYQLGLTLEGSMGWADATLALSYFDRDFTYNADNSDYLFDISYLSNSFPYYNFYDFGDTNATAFSNSEQERWSVEARLTTPSDSDSKWAGLVGAFYSNTESDGLFRGDMVGLTDTVGGRYIQYTAYFYTGVLPGASPNFWFGVYENEIQQTAIFGELSYDVTENLTITAGGRWYELEEDRFIWQGQLAQGEVPVLSDYTLTFDGNKAKDDGFVPKINVTYNIDDDKLVYATYSEGFRRGGVNVLRDRSIIGRSYDSDILKNYEIGAKTTWANGTVRLNITAYQMIWEDIQVQASDPQQGVYALGVVNAPEAEINGFEMDFAWAVTEGLTIDGTYGWLDPEITKGDDIFESECQNGTLCDPLPLEPGTRLPISPEWKGSLGLDYQFQADLLGGQPYLRLDWSHVDESVNGLSGLSSNEIKTHGSTQTTDLKIGLNADGWSAVFYVNNLTDERSEYFFNSRWGDNAERLSISRPRTYGVSFRKSF